MKWKSLSLWKIDAIAVGILAGVTLTTWFCIMQPALTRASREAQAEVEHESHRREVSELSRSLAINQFQLRSVQSELQALSQPCWTDTDSTRRITQIQACASQAGLTVDRIEPAEIENVSGRKVLPLRLSAQGSYASVVAAIAAVRATQLNVVVRDLTLMPAPNSDTDVVVNAELLWVSPLDATSSPSR